MASRLSWSTAPISAPSSGRSSLFNWTGAHAGRRERAPRPSLVFWVHPFFFVWDERAAAVRTHDLFIVLRRGDSKEGGVAVRADEPDHFSDPVRGTGVGCRPGECTRRRSGDRRRQLSRYPTLPRSLACRSRSIEWERHEYLVCAGQTPLDRVVAAGSLSRYNMAQSALVVQLKVGNGESALASLMGGSGMGYSGSPLAVTC